MPRQLVGKLVWPGLDSEAKKKCVKGEHGGLKADRQNSLGF